MVSSHIEFLQKFILSHMKNLIQFTSEWTAVRSRLYEWL